MIEFKPLAIEDKDRIEQFTSRFSSYSDFNFISLYSWSLHSQTQFYLDDEIIMLKLPDYSSQTFINTFMVLDNNDINIPKIFEAYRKNDQIKFDLLPEDIILPLKVYLQNNNIKFNLVKDRDSFDYLLDVDRTVKAEGGMYSDYRYKISKFKREWSKIITDYSFNAKKKSDVQLAYVLFKDWVLSRNTKDVNYEYESLAFSRFLTIVKYSNSVKFKALAWGNKLVSFCSYEILNKNTAIGHFVKYDPSIPYIFPYTVYEVCKDLQLIGIKTLNIEQDLGIPNLRASKEHLRPVGYLEKYSLSIVIG